MSGLLLFSPMTIRGVSLRNRIVVPPMHQYSAVKGFPTDWHLMNAGKFAAGGAGLVVVESTKVERRGCGTVGDLGIWDDAFIVPLSRLVRFIREQGAAAGIQLGHSGRKARARRPWEGDGALQRTPEIDDRDAWSPVAPSAIAHSEKWPVPRALERGEVKDLVQAWGQAARRAQEAGFEMLELHGAHGYLVHEFLSERSNERTDEYGGSEANRMRFVIEIAEEVRTHWPADKPLFVRLSVQDNAGWGPEQSARLARILKSKGVDVIDCSSGGITDAAPILGAEIKYNYQVPLSEYVRRHADIMTMAVGPDHPRRPGRANLTKRTGGSDRGGAGNPQQSQLADGCCLEIGRRRPVPECPAPVRLLAGNAGPARLRHPALDLAGGASSCCRP